MKARTRKKRRRSLRLSLLLLLGLLVLLGIGFYYLLSLPIWKITEVTVNGAKILSAEEVRNLAGIPLTENLFLSSFARSRNNLHKISAIKSFHLYRIPPGTVLINLKERSPIAIIILKGKSAIIDEDGFIINRNPNLTLNLPNLTELPAISGLGSAEVINEERITPKVSTLIKSIIVELSQLLGSRRIQLQLGGLEKICFVLDDILLVKLGRDENIQDKMAVFKQLLPVIANKWAQVEYVDVRFPNNPVIKYR